MVRSEASLPMLLTAPGQWRICLSLIEKKESPLIVDFQLFYIPLLCVRIDLCEACVPRQSEDGVHLLPRRPGV